MQNFPSLCLRVQRGILWDLVEKEERAAKNGGVWKSTSRCSFVKFSQMPLAFLGSQIPPPRHMCGKAHQPIRLHFLCLCFLCGLLPLAVYLIASDVDSVDKMNTRYPLQARPVPPPQRNAGALRTGATKRTDEVGLDCSVKSGNDRRPRCASCGFMCAKGILLEYLRCLFHTL